MVIKEVLRTFHHNLQNFPHSISKTNTDKLKNVSMGSYTRMNDISHANNTLISPLQVWLDNITTNEALTRRESTSKVTYLCTKNNYRILVMFIQEKWKSTPLAIRTLLYTLQVLLEYIITNEVLTRREATLKTSENLPQ